MRKRSLVSIASIAAVVAASLAMALLLMASCGSDDDSSVTLTIPEGASFRAAAESLAAHDVIDHPRIFGWYAARRGMDRNIHYGTYFIRRGGSWSEVLTTLAQGRGIMHRVRITEGWPLWEIIPRLARALELEPESLEVAVRDTALLRRLDIPSDQPTAEGYLFPDTYDFPDDVTARQAVDLMVRRFEYVWKPEWTARLAEIDMTRHEIVTLASIVEKEVRRGEERPVVAAVYLNRLKIGMPLQADPTVQYALKRRPGRVYYRDLRVDSPYNTYRNTGLPPGPIAAPGAASLEASLFPANVPYRFFVAHPNGHHEFRTTYREHLKAIEMVRATARREAAARRDSIQKAQAAEKAAQKSATTATTAAPSAARSTTPPAAPATRPDSTPKKAN